MTAALSIRNLTKVDGSGFQALKGISLEVQPGDFFALLGQGVGSLGRERTFYPNVS